MQKSMVQELNGLTGSTIFVNRSFTTTVATDDVYDLRKSRINNLPNYKKEDLSGKLNFVVVFQGIEIERLSVQVEGLRVKLKDCERQMFNNGNYEVQIRELTEKCFAYEQQREQYREEIQKMNMICQKLYNELEEMRAKYAEVDFTMKDKLRLEQVKNEELQQQLEKWKARFSAMERNKNKQIEDVRMMMETQRKSMIDREIRDLTIRFQSERSSLQNQIKRLVDALENRNNQIRKLESHISRLQITITELRESQRKIHEYENKVALISQQTIRLNQKLRNKQEEVDRLREDLALLEQRLNQNQRMNKQYDILVIKYQDLQRDLNNVQNKNNKLQDENRRNIPELQKVGQLQRVLDQYIQEIERYNKALKDKSGAIEKLERELANSQNKNSKLEDELRRFQVQFQKVGELEGLLDQYANEIQRLGQILQQKVSEADKLKENYSTIEIKYQESKNKEKRLPELEGKVNQFANELKIRLNELEDWKNKYINLEKSIDKYIVLEKDKKTLQAKVNELSQQNDQLKKKNGAYETEIASLRNMEKDISEYKRKIAQMSQQIERMNALICQKIQQLQQLKEFFKKIQGGLSQSRQVEQKLMENIKQVQQLVLQVDEARRQSDFFQDKLVLAQNEIRRLINEMNINLQEKERLNEIDRIKNIQFEQMKAELRDKDNQMKGLRENQKKLNELQVVYSTMDNKLKQADNVFADLDRKYKSECGKSEQYMGRIKTLSSEIEKMKKEGLMSPAFVSEFMKIKQQCELKDKEIKNIQLRFQTVELIIKALRAQLEKQANFTKINQQKIINVAKTVTTFSQFVNKAIKMQSQITKLAQQNIALQSNTRIMNFQIQNTQNLHSSNVKSINNPYVSEVTYQKTVTTSSQGEPLKFTHNTRFALGSVANYH